MQELISSWPSGAIVERRLDTFQVRMVKG